LGRKCREQKNLSKLQKKSRKSALSSEKGGREHLTHVTNIGQTPDFSRIRDMDTSKIRDIKETSSVKEFKECIRCRFCGSKNVVKRGKRKKKLEVQQLYLCKDCGKSFTPQIVKGRTYPLRVIFDGLSFYNQGWSLDKTCRFLKERYGIEVKDSTLSSWIHPVR